MLFTILPFVLGFWLLFRGFMAVGVASEMMGVGIKGAGWTMTLGILVIISAFLVLFNPIIGVGVVVFWVGLSLLLAGVDLIAHAVTLRRLRKEPVTVDNVPIRLRPGNILPGRSVFYTDSR